MWNIHCQKIEHKQNYKLYILGLKQCDGFQSISAIALLCLLRKNSCSIYQKKDKKTEKKETEL